MSIALMTDVWRLDMPPTDKMVLLALADAANDSGVCWTPVRARSGDKLDLLTKCSLSERAIQGAIKRLCESGYLSRVERPGKGVIYTVTPAGDAPRSMCAPQEMPPAGNDIDPRSRCGEIVRNPNTTSEAKASSVAVREPKVGRIDVARGFLAFWAAYPKHKSKDTAAKAFAKAMARIESEDPLAVILAGIERALPGWDDPQFIPYPATWLNAGGWDDDAPTPRTGSTHDRNRPANTNTARDDRLGRMLAGAVAAADGPERLVLRGG